MLVVQKQCFFFFENFRYGIYWDHFTINYVQHKIILVKNLMGSYRLQLRLFVYNFVPVSLSLNSKIKDFFEFSLRTYKVTATSSAHDNISIFLICFIVIDYHIWYVGWILLKYRQQHKKNDNIFSQGNRFHVRFDNIKTVNTGKNIELIFFIQRFVRRYHHYNFIMHRLWFITHRSMIITQHVNQNEIPAEKLRKKKCQLPIPVYDRDRRT